MYRILISGIRCVLTASDVVRNSWQQEKQYGDPHDRGLDASHGRFLLIR
jgi:hypothetical protein